MRRTPAHGQHHGRGLSYVDTVDWNPGYERTIAKNLPYTDKVTPPTLDQIHDAQVAVACHALTHGWPQSDLRQVLGALGIGDRTGLDYRTKGDDDA